MEHATCKIQWVGSDGKPTPDENPAIGYVRRDAYREPYAAALNGFIDYTETEWFPICAEHARQLSDGGMHHWTFRAIQRGGVMAAKLTEKPVGTCPACGESVFNSTEPDGPVWTCPADLAPSNPYWEPPLPPFDTITEAARERSGYFGNCCEDTGDNHGQCYDRLPLHSACYERGDY